MILIWGGGGGGEGEGEREGGGVVVMVVVGVVAALGNYCKTYESYQMNKINVPLCGAGQKKWEVGGRAKT